MRYYYTPSRMGKMKNSRKLNTGEYVEQPDLSYTCWGECVAVSSKLTMQLPYNPIFVLPGIHPREMET